MRSAWLVRRFRLALAGVVTVSALGRPEAAYGQRAGQQAGQLAGRRSSAPSVTGTSVLGAHYVHLFGRHAERLLAPQARELVALARIPPGHTAAEFGMDAVAPGIGRVKATVAALDSFANAHPGMGLEIASPLHPLLDRVGAFVMATAAREARHADGSGVMVGVADTGLDVLHPEMRDAQGHSRVAWLLDFSLPPQGIYPDLESRFAVADPSKPGSTLGAVFDRAMIEKKIADVASGACVETSTAPCAPTDEAGHGTHVTGIAASTGIDGKYPGIAPLADIVFVRVASAITGEIDNDNVLRAVDFMFDRADAESRPMVVNLSLGSDFGPHDGTLLWEETLASHVGSAHPGHIMVAAAGNSGSIAETPIHESARVSPYQRVRVPIRTRGADDGAVQVWVTARGDADLRIGLDGPDGEWIAPIAEGNEGARNTEQNNAGVIFGSNLTASPIPTNSKSAVVLWAGAWPPGTYNIVLEGSGLADMYLEGLRDAQIGSPRAAYFAHGVREATVNQPATHPSILGVGCTLNRALWTSIAGAQGELHAPAVDSSGGLPLVAMGQLQIRSVEDGEICWFSSAGPTATGVPKPEIAAPGAMVISALSRSALPGSPQSIFTTNDCPATPAGTRDSRCLQVDSTHGVSAGTSMSAPVVAGVVALLLQNDPTLTQDEVRALLQAGAHRFRGPAPFDDQSGPGEVDAIGALDALDRMRSPSLALPDASHSWLTLSSTYVTADGSTPMTAIVELRTANEGRADLFDSSRLAATVLLDGAPLLAPTISRRGPGVWTYVWSAPPGLGGRRVTFGAEFDGRPIVPQKTLVVATDVWTAGYASAGRGSGCQVGPSGATSGLPLGEGVLWVVAWLGCARRKRLSRRSIRMRG